MNGLRREINKKTQAFKFFWVVFNHSENKLSKRENFPIAIIVKINISHMKNCFNAIQMNFFFGKSMKYKRDFCFHMN